MTETDAETTYQPNEGRNRSMAGAPQKSFWSEPSLNVSPKDRYQIIATDTRVFAALLSIFFNIPLAVAVIYALIIIVAIILAVLTTGRTFLVDRIGDAWIFLPLLAGLVHIILTIIMFAAINPRRTFGPLKTGAESFDSRSTETTRAINTSKSMALLSIVLAVLVIAFAILLSLDLFETVNLFGNALPLGPFTSGQALDNTFDFGIVITSWIMIAVELFLVLLPFTIARVSTLPNASKSPFNEESFYVRISTVERGKRINLFTFVQDAETFDKEHSIVTDYSGQRFSSQPVFEASSTSYQTTASVPMTTMYQHQQPQQQQPFTQMSMQSFAYPHQQQQLAATHLDLNMSQMYDRSSSSLVQHPSSQGLVKRASTSAANSTASTVEIQRSPSNNDLQQSFDSYSATPQSSVKRTGGGGGGINFASVADSMLDV